MLPRCYADDYLLCCLTKICFTMVRLSCICSIHFNGCFRRLIYGSLTVNNSAAFGIPSLFLIFSSLTARYIMDYNGVVLLALTGYYCLGTTNKFCLRCPSSFCHNLAVCCQSCSRIERGAAFDPKQEHTLFL